MTKDRSIDRHKKGYYLEYARVQKKYGRNIGLKKAIEEIIAQLPDILDLPKYRPRKKK